MKTKLLASVTILGLYWVAYFAGAYLFTKINLWEASFVTRSLVTFAWSTSLLLVVFYGFAYVWFRFSRIHIEPRTAKRARVILLAFLLWFSWKPILEAGTVLFRVFPDLNAAPKIPAFALVLLIQFILVYIFTFLVEKAFMSEAVTKSGERVGRVKKK